jgi:hypothetical protein
MHMLTGVISEVLIGVYAYVNRGECSYVDDYLCFYCVLKEIIIIGAKN